MLLFSGFNAENMETFRLLAVEIFVRRGHFWLRPRRAEPSVNFVLSALFPQCLLCSGTLRAGAWRAMLNA
jgi:hypothetical protein